MRKAWIGVTLVAGFALAAAPRSALAQQQTSPSQPSATDQGAPAPAVPPKPTRGSRAAPAMQSNPDLDTDDQLAPSQMKQQMPGAVSEPGGVPHKPAHTGLPAAARPTAAAGRVVSCSGNFAKDSSHLKLAMAYDSKNITFTDVDASGGTKVPASVLFPNDPKRRLEVWWSNPAARSTTYLIVIGGQSTWAAPGGMHLGMTLAQLEKLNHKPFKLKGFDKDGIATVSDWDGGALGELSGGCKSGLSLRADRKASTDAIAALPNDKEFTSADAAIRAVKPTVSEILIGY